MNVATSSLASRIRPGTLRNAVRTGLATDRSALGSTKIGVRWYTCRASTPASATSGISWIPVAFDTPWARADDHDLVPVDV